MSGDLVQCDDFHYTLSCDHTLFRQLCDNALWSTETIGEKKFRCLYDVSSITENPRLFQNVIQFWADRYRSMGCKGPTHILAIETRGCILGAPLALTLGIPFVMMRRERVRVGDYVQDGLDEPPLMPLAIRQKSITPGARVVLVDDFISSGKTMHSALYCVKAAGASIVEVAAVCDVRHAGGVRHIHSQLPFKETPVLSFLRLHKSSDVLCYKTSRVASRL